MSSIEALETVAYGPRVSSSPTSPDGNVPARDTAGKPTSESVAMLVRELFMRAREARRNVMRQWKRNYYVLNNKQYRPGVSPWQEEPAVSSIWPTVASATAWMTDQRPTLEVTPSAEPNSPYWDFFQELAQDMNVCLNATFTNHGLDGEIVKALWDVYTYGIGYFKTTWEPWLAEGLGDAAFRRVDPFTLYPDPHAKSHADATHFTEAKQMTIADADRAWPGAAAKIRSANFLEEIDEAPHKLDDSVRANQPRVAMGALAPATTPSYARQGTGNAPGKPTDSPVVTILECWVRGYILEKTDDPDVTKVADDWRCIVVCGNAVLLDEPASEVNAYGTHPYSRLVLFDTGEFYGPCIVEFLAPIQRIINWLLMSINRNIYLMGNPVLVEDMRSASRNKKFTNGPGQRLEGTLSNIGWMSPPQMHPQMSMQLVQYYDSRIETISGLSAMIRGFAPTGRNAQGVLDSVQDAAFVRVRASLRELERALRDVATKMSANIGEFYTEDRLMSIIGPDGQHTHLALRARHFYTPPEYQLDEDGGVKLSGRVPLRFSLIADAGSQLPTSKQARAAEAKHLYQLGVIDEYEVLKAVQWPNYALVAQRTMEAKAMAAAADASKKKS